MLTRLAASLLASLSLVATPLAARSEGPPRSALGRVIASAGASTTLELSDGYLLTGDEVEVWTPTAHWVATVTLPNDMLQARDRRAIRLTGRRPPERALVAFKGQFASFVAARAALDAIPPTGIGRVVSVEGATATVAWAGGIAIQRDEVDMFTPDGVKVVTLALPERIDMMMAGDRLSGVGVLGAPPVAGAILVDRARHATFDEAQRALPAPRRAPAAPEASGPQPSDEGCVFTPAELRAALGFAVEAGRGEGYAFQTGRSLSCRWSEAGGRRWIQVNRLIMTTGDPARNAAQTRRMLAGRLEDLPGDADGACWQVDQGDLTDVTLHYFRNNTSTEVRISGVDVKDPAAVSAMRARVLRLRRL